MDKVVFVTGRLAAKALHATMEDMRPDFEYEVAVMPISVAALMTPPWIAEHLKPAEGTTLIMIPGLCEGDLSALEARTQVKTVRGPKDLKSIPDYFGRPQERPGYGISTVKILAEIHDATDLEPSALLARAESYRRSGADIIDLGCAVGRPWPQAGAAVRLLKRHGFAVSIDTFDRETILEADRAGVDYILSINGSNLDLAPHLRAAVVVVPDFDDGLDSLSRNVEAVERMGLRYIIDPIINPINFGFADSLRRLMDVRRRWPDAYVMIGTHHITELLDADSIGVNAVLMGLAQELNVNYVLTTEVAHWARGAVHELHIASQLMAYSHARGMLPKDLEDRLLVAKDRKPPLHTEEELRELQQLITDPNFRIYVAQGQIYAFNAERFVQGTNIQEIFDRLEVDEPTHAFYLGKELMKAYIALILDKAYIQEQSLNWGYLTPDPEPVRHVRLTQRLRRRAGDPKGEAG